VVHLVVAREGDDVPVIFGPSVHAPADGKLAERSFAQEVSVDFELPAELTQRLADLDDFIEREIRPLEQQDDNERFFDHRREYARTDFEHGGVPRAEWEELLAEMFRRAALLAAVRAAVDDRLAVANPRYATLPG
jgi:hypothetical protein